MLVYLGNFVNKRVLVFAYRLLLHVQLQIHSVVFILCTLEDTCRSSIFCFNRSIK
jgi:hypothetical protein